MDPLRKCISLGGPQTEGTRHDYTLFGNREYFEASNTRWVKMWVDWRFLQPSRPSSRDASWAQLNDAQWWALHSLDRQIRAVNDHSDYLNSRGRGRMAVMLSVYHQTPDWASNRDSADLAAAHGRGYDRKWPVDVGSNSPWAWFIGHLTARYKTGAARNPRGPHRPDSRDGAGYDPWYGNTAGAYLGGIEIVNEANYLFWPQHQAVAKVAAMMRSAHSVAYSHGWHNTGQKLWAPGTSDFPDPGGAGANPADPNRKYTDYRVFTDELLKALARWRPTVHVGWSQHNYNDVKRPFTTGSRAEEVRNALVRLNWRSGGDRYVWLTEGGYNTSDQALQRSASKANFDRMRATPDVAMWTWHHFHDTPYQPQYHHGLRDDFDEANRVAGAPKPAWYAWRDELPGLANT